MTRTDLPSVGFDRFVKLSWANYALDLAVSKSEHERLKKWLNSQIEGEVSARKTFNLLNNLWLNSFTETEHIRAKAITLAPIVMPQDRIILHWGMAIAKFELFQVTVSVIGRILRLQGSFKGKEIQMRVAEIYSNQGTIPRAVSRIIQSLCNWKVLLETEKHTFIAGEFRPVIDEKLLSWLLLATLNRKKDQPVLLMEVFRLPELFWFEILQNGLKVVRDSPDLTVIREGMDREYVLYR